MALTEHREGSVAELWKIALPLMLSSLSVLAMLFVDRLLLARYSLEALNAVVNSATLGWAFVFSWMTLAGISEVFVAQYNGAGRKEQFGEPVWQMIWLSFLSLFFFIPFALWGGSFFYGDSPERAMERDYFYWMMAFGPSVPIYSALCGFFIGQGKTKVITLLAIAANIVNALLDYVLIFGVEDWIPSMGVKGAAIATSGSLVFQAAVLAFIFLNKTNRSLFGTNDYSFRWKPFLQCVKIGLPGAVFAAVEMLGWAAYYELMKRRGDEFILVAGICQSVVILLLFFGDGVSKAATALAGNFIGGKKHEKISEVFGSGLYLHLLFFLATLGGLIWGTDLVIEQFMQASEQRNALAGPLNFGLLCILIHLLFEGIRMLLSGILTAAGDTIFLLLGGSLSVWLFLIAPVYFLSCKANLL